MPKAKAHPDQIGFVFDTPSVASGPGGLAGLEARISGTVGTILASAGRPREVVAAEMSVLLDDDVSRSMLDAYASPARDGHKVPMSRFLGLVAITARLDLFDPLVREIGGALLIGEEVHTARIGQIETQIARLNEERRRLKASAQLIRGGVIT